MNLNLNPGITSLKTRRQKFGIGSMLLFLIIGGIVTTVGFFIVNSTKIDSSWTRTSGEIVDITSKISDGSTMYSPVVEYKVDGQSYQATSSIRTSSRPNKGDSREVAYNPSDPEQSKLIESGGVQWLMYLFPLAGILLLVLGPLLFIRSLTRSRAISDLMRSGRKLQGVLVDIQTSGYNSKKAGYKIVVAAADSSGAVQNYVSDSLTGIGGLSMADYRNTPIPIDVYVNPNNPKDYYVDIADIPNITTERIGQLLNTVTQNTQPAPFTPPTYPQSMQQAPSAVSPSDPPLPPSKNQQ